MRKLLLAAAATIAIAAPAAAHDGSGYVGVDLGALFPKSNTVFGSIDFTNAARTDFPRQRVAVTRYNVGYDVDLNAGYDFGMFRLEGELGYKRASIKDLNIEQQFVTALNTGAGTAFTTSDNFAVNNRTSVLSGMVNGLVDFGGDNGWGGYLGGGVGIANVKRFGDSNSKFAWQLLGGVYTAVSSNIDVGLKYRYFRAGRSDGSSSFGFSPVTGTCAGAIACSGGTAFFDATNRFTSHSVLLSLTYNFAAPAPPPPPPPPPPPVERGERGQ